MKNVFILTINSELESAKNLGWKAGTDITPKYIEDHKNDIVIRNGIGNNWYSRNGTGYDDFPNVVNSSSAIKFNVQKRSSLRRLSEYVKTPKIYERTVPAGQLAVYRPVEHSGGKGFAVKEGPFQIESGNYATEYIVTDKEFRAWVCNGKVLFAQRVTKRKDRLAEKYPCRSLWPYKFTADIPKVVTKMAVKVAKTLELDYGACDILYKDGEYYLLEFNTAPSFDSDRVIDFFRKNLHALMRKKFPKIDIGEVPVD